jgi:hypothetical protein
MRHTCWIGPLDALGLGLVLIKKLPLPSRTGPPLHRQNLPLGSLHCVACIGGAVLGLHATFHTRHFSGARPPIPSINFHQSRLYSLLGRPDLCPRCTGSATRSGAHMAAAAPAADPGGGLPALQNGWPARPDGTAVLPEYLPALARVCVRPELMADSPLQQRLAHIHAAVARRPIRETFQATLTAFLVKAFGLTSNQAVQAYTGPTEFGSYANFYQAGITLYTQYSWERPFLHAALRQLTESCDDSASMAVLASLMAESAGQCLARKQATFASIVNRLPFPEPQPLHSDTTIGAAAADPVAALFAVGGAAAAARGRLHAAAAAALEQTKERALQATFLQPTIAYYRAAGDALEGDVDVHGSNTYLALLEAALGVRTGRLPLLSDEAKGVFHTMAVPEMAAALAALWADDAFGKQVGAVAAASRGIALRSWRAPNQMIWPTDGDVRAVADAAVDPSPSNAAPRAALAPYLVQFCHYFSEGFLLPRLFTRLSTDDALLADLQAVFAVLKTVPPQSLSWRAGESGAEPPCAVMATIPDDVTDVRYWMWDMSVFPPTLNAAAARSLFAAIGVATWPGETARMPVAAGPATAAGGAGGAAAQLEQPAQPATVARIPAADMRLSAAGDVRGGGTGREFLTNLAGEGTQPWNKWLHPGHVQRSWALAELVQPRTVARYGLCSANDCPHRDPIAWTLRGLRADNGAWEVLHAVVGVNDASGFAMPQFTDRWQWRWFDISAAHQHVFKAVRLEIDAVAAPGDGLQLGHWHLLSPVPAPAVSTASALGAAPPSRIPAADMQLTAAGDIAGGASGRERVSNLAGDGTQPWNKWVHPGYVERTWVKATLVGPPRVIVGYRLCSANDCPHRDPSAWTLRGLRADNGAWEVLHSVASVNDSSGIPLPHFTDRWQWRNFDLPEDRRHAVSAVRLDIDAVRQPGDCAQLGHWHLYAVQAEYPSATACSVL